MKFQPLITYIVTLVNAFSDYRLFPHYRLKTQLSFVVICFLSQSFLLMHALPVVLYLEVLTIDLNNYLVAFVRHLQEDIYKFIQRII